MANRKESAQDILQTVLTAQSAGIKLPEATQKLVEKLLTKQLSVLEQAESAEDAHQRQSLEIAKRIQKQKEQIRASCNHMKTPTRTALQGQRLQNGQMALVCARCGSNFHTNPIAEEGQVAPPARLIPSEGVGGAEVSL